MSLKGVMEWTSPVLRLTKWLEQHSPIKNLEKKMDSRRGRGGRNRNVFKGCVLVSILIETHPRRFKSRAVAVKFAKRLLREGYIKSIFGSRSFEDSAQLYMWQDDDAIRRHRATMTSSGVEATPSQQERIYESHQRAGYESLRREEVTEPRYERLDAQLIEDVKNKVLNRSEAYNIVTSYNTFFQELQRDFRSEGDKESEHNYYNEAPPRQQQPPLRQQQHQPQQSGDHQYQKSQPPQQQPYQPHRHHQQTPPEHSQQKHRVKPQQQQQQQHKPASAPREATQYLSQQTPRSRHPHSHQSRKYPQGQPSNTPHRSQAFPSSASSGTYPDPYTSDVKRESTCSTDSSVDTQTYFRTRDRNSGKNQQHSVPPPSQPPPLSSRHPQKSVPGAKMASPATNSHTPPQIRDHSSIPEERTSSDPALNAVVDKDKERPEMTSSDYEMTSVGTLSSHPQAMMLTSNNTSSSPENMAVGSGVGATMAMVGESAASRPARWQHEPAAYSYSDNEKQLIEEMKRMKKEHQNILRTYEGRINKLMAKMHELRNIAEMLENSSTKSSPYGLLPAKATLLNIIASGTKLEEGDKKGSVTGEGDVPPPLPPRPGRGGRIYPNKPIIHTRTRMKALPWNRIILGETGTDGGQTTVWHGMPEAKFDTEEVERLYSCPPEPSTDDVTLLDDIYAVRGRPKHQPLAMFDAERSQRILTEMRNLRCSLSDVINAISSLDCRHLHQDSFAELLELLNSPRDVDKILHHVRRKGPGQLDTPEFLIFEMSKLDHFRERLEFLRFKNKLQINLFEIDQQLRELNTACDELVNNLPLKNVLETVLALGNYLNGGTERGQADGFGLDVLNKLKDFVDRSRRGNLLELIMRTYCLQYEADLDLGCPTRFRLPEPSNMRHAAQVSFEEIQKALRDLREELSQVRDRLEVLSKRESSNLTIALRVTSENFLTSAVEVLAEEKRFLEDTKGHFWKTTAYFLYNRQCTPQEFFQTWATFLHDCKYYWKLAHRNLARDKFERDFSTKCQLSCSSLPGFTNLKNKMIRTVASLQNDQEMRASKAQQLLHINNWIESLGRYDQELGPELPHVPRDATYGNGPLDPGAHATATTPGQHDRKHQHQQHHRGREQGGGSHAHHHQQQQQHGPARSSSPKPITSTPPNVHKPQPINHVSPTTVSSTYSSTSFPNNAPNGTGSGSSGPNNAPCNGGGSGGGGGYHHQHFQSDANALEEPYESLSRATMAMSQEAEPPRGDVAESGGKRHSQDGGQKKNPNFSLKSWLKREQRQRSSNDELPSPTGPSPQYPSPQQQQQPSAKSPTTPFNKLRNSVVQKFSGSGSSKKSNETPKSGGGSSSSNHHDAPVVPPKPPRALVDNDPPPSHQILFTPQQQQLQQQQQQAEETEPKRSSRDMPDYEARDYQNFYYQSRGGSKERGFPTGHESAPSTLSSVTSRDFSPNKFEAFTRVDGSRQRDSSRDRARYGSQERNLNPPNEALQQLAPPANADIQQKEGRGRNRAPIALNLGSNMSISDVYGRQEEDARQAQQQQQQQPQQQQAEVAPQPQYPANHLVVEGSRDAGPHLPPQPSNVDSKRVKANPVPVYKAKLIPNYENQTKLDPRMEHGIRGQAEPVHQPPLGHFAQSSNSSEVYRQELQRKSEMYVGSYPQQSPLSPTPPGQGSHHNTPNNQALSQTPPNQGSSSYTPHGPALSQTPPGSASYPLNQAPSQAQPNPAPSYNPHPSQVPPSQTPMSQGSYPHPGQVPPSQTPMSQGSYPHPGQAPFSQTTPKGSATSVTARDGGVGPVNPNSPDYDDFQTPARRSASAQNILDRGYGTDGYRQSHNSDPSGPSHSYLASIGNFSASLGSPTSKRGRRRGARGRARGSRETEARTLQPPRRPRSPPSSTAGRRSTGPRKGWGDLWWTGRTGPPP